LRHTVGFSRSRKCWFSYWIYSPKVNLSILSSLPNYEAKDIYEMVLVLVEVQVITLHDNKKD
jgi:hypothetical protein